MARDARTEVPASAARTVTTTCWECSANCGALATVRDGRVIDYAPNPQAPHSKGAFCIKGIRGAPGLTYNPNRLLYPHRRTGTARGSGGLPVPFLLFLIPCRVLFPCLIPAPSPPYAASSHPPRTRNTVPTPNTIRRLQARKSASLMRSST